MATLLVVFFFLFSSHQIATSHQTSCQNQCISNNLRVRFPFGFDANRCSYPGFNLSCQTQVILNLPYTGNFIVQNINYRSQAVVIKDPQNCLAKRFLDSTFNLSGSPFVPEFYRFFTFLNCSKNSTSSISESRRRTVNCLSNESFTVLALPTVIAESYVPLPSSCTELKRSVSVPVAWPRLSESETRLIWSQPCCVACEESGGTCGFQDDNGLKVGCSGSSTNGLPRSAKYGIIIGAGIPGLLCIIGIVIYLCGRARAYGRRNQPTTEFGTSNIAPQPSLVVLRGLDETTIESYPKTQLGNSGRLPKPNDNTCPICLSEYEPKDALRTIPDCNHYFHANCIDEWLKMNASCPLCRNSPEGSSLVTPSSSLSSSSSSLSAP